MKKRTYRSKKVNEIDWNNVKENLSGENIAVAIDVAKVKQYALLFNEDETVSKLFYWEHPQETPVVLNILSDLSCPVTVILESTSTYGDAMRYQFRERGFDVHQASAKRVHDASEVYDGVPSSHDAKAATIIGRFYRDGLTSPWREESEAEREMSALRREYDMHKSQYRRNHNRLEAYLSRHWPEFTHLLALDSVALECLLITYGSPQQIAANANEAMKKMKKASRSMLSQGKIKTVVESAKTTLGTPCIKAEQRYLQALAQEMQHSRKQAKNVQKLLEATVDNEAELHGMGRLIGRVTTAVLLSFHLDPRLFTCAQAFQKAMGLNLKEKSSGRYVGQLKITKRGSAKARQYLYFAALRLIQKDPIAKEWYERKVNSKAKNKTVIAVMRKLAKGLWHVARGQAYDANKLFSLPKIAA